MKVPHEISRVARAGRIGGVVTKVLFSCGIVGLASGCGKDTVVDRRTVTLYTFAADASRPACTVPNDAYALYSAAGDFEPDPSAPPQSGVRLDAISPDLDAIPDTTRQLALDVTHAADGGHWRGFGGVDPQGDVGVLLWPYGHDCALAKNFDPRPGAAIAAYDPRHVLVTGGAGGVPSFVVDLANGSVSSPGRDLAVPRASGSATAYASGVVVAGGESGGVLVDRAEIFHASSSSFEGTPIDLIFPRSHHGSALLANGKVLLVGGVGENDALYHSMEVIDPAAGTATLTNVASLATARKDPTVLRLANGELAVLGGVDSTGTPVGAIEFFSADASAATGSAQIDASSHATYAALPAGGLLAVVSPDSGSPTTVALVRSDHIVETAPPLTGVPAGANVHLFAGAGGAPLLWTGSAWFRWSPWTGAFAPFAETASATGASSAGGPPADATSAVLASPDSGIALWLDDAGLLSGLRFDARGAYTTDVGALLATDTKSIAPDRLPGADVSFEAAAPNEPATGLSLGAGAAVVVTDANYADFSLDFDTGKLAVPTLFFRDESGNEFTIGVDAGATCVVADASHVHAERRGSTVSASTDGGALSACATSVIASARLTVGLRGKPAPSSVMCKARNLVVKRD